MTLKEEAHFILSFNLNYRIMMKRDLYYFICCFRNLTKIKADRVLKQFDIGTRRIGFDPVVCCEIQF